MCGIVLAKTTMQVSHIRTCDRNDYNVLTVVLMLFLCTFIVGKSSARVVASREAILDGQKIEFADSKGMLRAEWIVEAVQKHVKIEISNAIISGDLDLQYAEIEREIVLLNCEFKGIVDLSFATCKQNVVFQNAIFDGTTEFNSMTCERNFFLDNANFQPSEQGSDGNPSVRVANFQNLEVKSVFSMANAHFRKGVTANFNNVSFEKLAVFKNVIFDGNVAFQASSIAGEIDFRGSTFGQEAAFWRTHVGGPAYFQGSKFFGVADFSEAKFAGDTKFNQDVDGDQSLSPAIFSKGAEFGNVICQRDLNLDGVEFKAVDADSQGNLPSQVGSFVGLVVRGNYSMASANFGKRVEANFNGASFDKDATFSGSNFEGEVDFDGSTVGGTVNFRGASFAQGATFAEIQVGGQSLFEGTKFLGAASFYQGKFSGNVVFNGVGNGDQSLSSAIFSKGAEFGDVICERDLNLDGVEFKAVDADNQGNLPEQVGSFVGLVVRGNYSMASANFGKRVEANFNGASFDKDATFSGSNFEGEVDFDGSTVGRTVNFRGASFAEGATFAKIQVGGQSLFEGTKFLGAASFYQGKFSGNVVFNGVANGDQSLSSAIFSKGAEFGDVICERDLNLDGVEFKAADADAKGNLAEQVGSFVGMTVKGDCSILSATFGKGVKAKFNVVSFDNDATFSGSNFEGEVEFDGSTVGGIADFRGVSFAEATFAEIQVHGQSQFQGAKFLGAASFYQGKFSGNVFFNGDADGDPSLSPAIFSKGAEFDGITCESDLNLNQVEFKAADPDAKGNLAEQVGSFVGMTVKGNCSIVSANFGKAVKANLNGAIFDKDAIFRGSNFEGEVDFDGSTVGGKADFRGASFAEGATFAKIQVGGQSLFEGTKFLGAASFYQGKFSGDLLFNGDADGDPSLSPAIFSKGAEFDAITCGSYLTLDGVEFKAADPDAKGNLAEQVGSFVGMTVKGNCSIVSANFGKAVKANFNGASFDKDAIFRGSNFEGEMEFDGSTVGGIADFRGASFAQGATFAEIQVHDQSQFQGAKFLGAASFYQGKFSGDVFFNGDADGDRSLSPAIFSKGAEFNGITCESDLNLNQVEFKAADPDGQGHLPVQVGSFVGIVTKGAFSMADVHFGKNVNANFIGATFLKNATLTGSNFEGEMEFDGSTVGGIADFRGASFAQGATFVAIQVGGQSHFEGTRFLGVAAFSLSRFAEDVLFDGALFAAEATFNGIIAKRVLLFRPGTGSSGKRVVFGGNTSFLACQIGDDLNFQGAQFKEQSNFSRTHIAGAGIFAETTFYNAATFVDLNIDGHCLFQSARFEKSADFSGVHIGSELIFQSAVLKDTAKFISAEVKGNAQFSSTGFDCPATFESAHFFKNVGFRGIIFNKYVDFIRTVIDGDVQFQGATFNQGSRFAGATIETADFTSAIFYGENNFAQIHFRGPAAFPGSRFSRLLNFNGAIADNDVVFSGATFSMGASFIGTHISGRAEFARATFDGISQFDFFEVSRGAIFFEAQFQNVVSFEACHFPGVTRFDGAVFHKSVVFRESSFDSVQFLGDGSVGRAGAQFQGDVDLRGCTYDRISVDWRSLIMRIRPFDRQPYAELEKALIGAGQDRSADDVYRARQRAEGLQKWNDRDFFGWFTNAMYGLVADYGVRPYALIYIGTIVIFLGTVFFSNPATVYSKIDGVEISPSSLDSRMWTWWGAFGLTVHYFLPVAILVGSRWSARDSRVDVRYPRFIRTTWRCSVRPSVVATALQIAGWILVPLGVAALTGLLRIKP